MDEIDDHGYYLNPATTPARPWEQARGDAGVDAPAVLRAQAWWNTRDYALLGFSSFNGTRRYKYLCAHLLAGNFTVGWVVRLSPTGAIDAQWYVEPPEGHKWDSLFIQPDGPQGTDIGVWGTTHQAISGPRDNYVAFYVIPGGVVDPYPQGQAPIGGGYPTDVLGRDPGPPGGGGECDPAAIADATVDEVQTRMAGELGGQHQQRAKNGSVEAIRREVPPLLERVQVQLPPGLITVENMGRAYAASFEIMEQLDNRVYATLLKHRIIEAAFKILGLPWPPPGQPAPQERAVDTGVDLGEPLVATLVIAPGEWPADDEEGG